MGEPSAFHGLAIMHVSRRLPACHATASARARAPRLPARARDMLRPDPFRTERPIVCTQCDGGGSPWMHLRWQMGRHGAAVR